MYKRPNAPFKPPRPLNVNSDGSASGRKSGQPISSGLKAKARTTEAPVSRSNEDQVSDSSSSSTIPKLVNKRVRLNPQISNRGVSQQPISRSVSGVATRENSATNADTDNASSSDKRYFTVQWRKKSNKKNKSWEGDGFISVSATGIALRIQTSEASYKLAGRTKNTALEGIIPIGVHEVEIDCETTKDSLFGGKGGADDVRIDNAEETRPSSITPAFKHHSVKSLLADEVPETEICDIKKENTSLFVEELADASVQPLILDSADTTDSKSVIVDEKLTKYLRHHQREGVSFLYDCIMGKRNEDQYGALLADEMGLGKTLMTITLIWTLLKQSPAKTEKNVVNKVLICCPVSLIDNWRKEFGKWLDINRIGILALNNKNSSTAKDKQDIVSFGKTKVYQVLIMNYEKVLACSAELSTVSVDLLVCDEGHRLKSATNKVLKFLAGMPVRRRVVLTGTPIQNDLNEFYNIVNFINPGLLGSSSEFQKEYLKPISRARDVNCFDSNIVQQGKEKSSLLIDITKSFTIRRTKAVIEDYLTVKTDVLVFCSPTKLQKSLFKFVIESMGFNSLVSSGAKEALPTINLLRKVCNSPSLLSEDTFFKGLVEKATSVPSELIPSALSSRTTGSKMNVAIPLLLKFREAGESAVLVSNYTQTLDLLERVLSKLNMSYARLDGSTPSSTRDALVTSFNKTRKYNVFLLSAKAGGIGLNLIGGSRLVLFDNDWNPSVDLQAMARVHRDGQQKPVFIYRLFTTGSIDEKIFQRQLMKNNLSDMFLDDNLESTSNIFGFEDLKDLFTVAETTCNTHDLLDCDCSGKGEELDLSQSTEKEESQASQKEEPHSSTPPGWMSASQFKDADQSDSMKKQTIRSAMSHYKHFDPQHFEHQMDTGDQILNDLIPKAKGDISFIFTHQRGRSKCDEVLD